MRLKTTRALAVKDWTGADRTLREVGKLNERIEVIEKEYSRKIIALQEEEREKKEGLLILKDSLQGNLEKFVKGHRDELPGEVRRIKTLPSGRVGLTLYTQIDVPNPQRTIEAIKRLEWTGCIKIEEIVNKSALLQLAPHDLKIIYAQRRDVERFFCDARGQGTGNRSQE